MEQRAMPYHSQGLARALAALRALSKAGNPQSLAELSRTLDLPKSTLKRLLTVMEDEGFVHKDGHPPEYSIGHSVLEIADAYRPADVATVAAPIMRALARELGFTTNLGVLEGRSVLHLHVEEPPRELRFAASGMLDYTHCTGLGKLLLAMLPAEEVFEHLPEVEPYAKFTEQTILTRKALDRELAAIRSSGFSVDDEERSRGVTCLAVPVQLGDTVTIALSVSAPSGELSESDRTNYLPRVHAAAGALASDPRFKASIAAAGKR